MRWGFARLMASRPVIAVVKAGSALALAVALAGAGVGVAALPATTALLAPRTVAADASPFTADQLAEGAQAVRDYSFGAHDLHQLQAVQYRMNQQLATEQAGEGGAATALDANGTAAVSATAPTASPARPAVDPAADPDQLTDQQLAAAFANADQRYCLDQAAISHLDDVHAVASTAFALLAACAALAVAGLAHVAFYRGRRAMAMPLMAAGGAVLVAFALLGAWAALDFDGLFTVFHSLFFEGQSWVFPSNSLLICMLPQGFWIGMGVVWLAVTAGLSILSFTLGITLIRSKKQQK